MAALKSAWSDATAQDRDDFSKQLLRQTHEEVSQKLTTLGTTVADQLWQTQP